MYVMQYAITLPADYDMQIIRTRVATRSWFTDDFAGLATKAYAIRERGKADSAVNEYAPFYVWTSLRGMNAFLWGDGFAGLCADFGRPRVRSWVGVAYERGPAYEAVPREATRHIECLDADGSPVDAQRRAIEEATRVGGTDNVHSVAASIDISRWELVLFTLWGNTGACGHGTRYTVLHTSTPHLEDLRSGAQW